MSTHIRPYIILAICLALCISAPGKASAQNLEDDLHNLDAVLEMAPDYYKNKETLLASLQSLLSYPNTSAEQKFTIYGQIFNESYSYSFDTALAALNDQEKIAKGLSERHLQQVYIDKALLFETAGMFLEARNIIDTQIDTSSLSQDLKLSYLYMMQRYWKDYKEYSDANMLSGAPIPAEFINFRKRYIEESSPEDFYHKQLIIFNLMDEGKNEEALSLNTALLDSIDQQSHEYAIMSYYQALIREYLGDPAGRLHWLIQSAVCDVKNAVRDYASLSSIATDLLENDVERSSRYIQISIEDALFYNAKLRPWQLARLIPNIDSAYKQKQEKIQSASTRRVTILCIVTAILLLSGAVLASIVKKQKEQKKGFEKKIADLEKDTADLQDRNETITEAFRRLSEADEIKQEQIVSLLGSCNSYLDKAKKNLSPEKMDAEIKNYYNAFDNAFLTMYPTFVEDFNALLKPDQRIELKKDDILNTELRIFALIKLGVTQSSTIASLLKYSVNTIYNYRAQIKNAALNERDDFEKNVKNIGKVDF